MDDTKLPDLEKLRGVKGRLKSLPPQDSVLDTTNWENRDISAPVVDVKVQKKKVRKLDFIRIPRDE